MPLWGVSGVGSRGGGERTDGDGCVLVGVLVGWNSGGSWDITHCGVAAVAEDFEAGLGGERLAARDDAVGAVDDGAAGWEAGEGGVVGDWAGGHFGGL